MDYYKEVKRLTGWIKDYVIAAGAVGTVVGISGGIDSAVVAGLCKRAFPEHCLGLIMPCHSNPEDTYHAETVAMTLEIPVKKIVLDPVYDVMLKALEAKDFNAMAAANIKPRLRMTALYCYAAEKNYLVAGTGNKSEIFVGYFTKYGDGGADLEPIGHLVKSEVRAVARVLGLPAAIIERPPSAGLWEGQTDEGEMGINYEELDNYILTGAASEQVVYVINQLRRKSEHKRSLPPIPPRV